MKTIRLVIFAKDIQRITGRGERHARGLIRKVKQAYGKDAHQFLTIDEFCDYSGLKKEDILSIIEA
jgi:hypothetical protein